MKYFSFEYNNLFSVSQTLMTFLQTDDDPCDFQIERLEAVFDKGLIISWEVSQHVCVMFLSYNSVQLVTLCAVLGYISNALRNIITFVVAK